MLNIQEGIEIAKLIDHVCKAITGHCLDKEMELMIRTLLSESAYLRKNKLHFHRKQLFGGPAKGIFQMEINTAVDIIKNYLRHRVLKFSLLKKATYRQECDWLAIWRAVPSALEKELVENDKFSIGMARMHYLRIPAVIPADNLCSYYKKYYNTIYGKGSVAKCDLNFINFEGARIIQEFKEVV